MLLFGVLDCNRLDVALQKLFAILFELQEHDAVAELGVAGNHAPAKIDGRIVEPEAAMSIGAGRQGLRELDVAATAAEIGGFGAEGEVGSVAVQFDGDLHGIARGGTALGLDWSRTDGLVGGEAHNRWSFSCRSLLLVGLCFL